MSRTTTHEMTDLTLYGCGLGLRWSREGGCAVVGGAGGAIPFHTVFSPPPMHAWLQMNSGGNKMAKMHVALCDSCH